MMATQDSEARLESIAALISPCPAPDVANGYDLCPVHQGSVWPCDTTKAAWLARGMNVKEQVRAAMDRAMAHLH